MDKELRDLLLLDGISGYEKNIRDYIRNYAGHLKSYKVETDNLGSVFLVKESKLKDAKTVMVSGHMDEVGLMIVKIRPNGILELNPIGGIAREVLTSQVLTLHSNAGLFKGVVPSIPPHLSAVYQNVPEVLLDIGAKTAEEVKSSGINLGDMVTFSKGIENTLNKDRFISKGIDNRFGCALSLYAAKKMDDLELPFNLVIGATVQEEVGLRGAETSANKYHPDVFIALDASPVNDSLDDKATVNLGEGFLVRILDPGNIMQRGLYDYFTKLAIKKKIKYQIFISQGRTDAAAVLTVNEGVLSTTIGLPARYIHSNASLFDLNDYEYAKKMLIAVLKSLNNDTIEMIKLKVR